MRPGRRSSDGAASFCSMETQPTEITVEQIAPSPRRASLLHLTEALHPFLSSSAWAHTFIALSVVGTSTLQSTNFPKSINLPKAMPVSDDVLLGLLSALASPRQRSAGADTPRRSRNQFLMLDNSSHHPRQSVF